MSEREIFEAALDRTDAAERRAYLDRACAGSPALRARVEGLLASHDAPTGFLNVPAPEQLKPHAPGGTRTFDSDRADPGDADGERDAEDPPPDTSFLGPPTDPGGAGTLGHYTVRRLLGRGAFGLVFEAFDQRLHRRVAIKVLDPQLAATSPPRKRFLREARSAAAVRHENVVQVYAVEEHPLPYLVMEFVAGGTLKDRLDGTGPLEGPEVLHLGRQMAAGLAAAHDKGLVHRDIKPANVLIENGPGARVVITDFGLARAADDASLTRSGVIAGTPMYMAPEQAQGLPLDHRADLFSLGSVLYQMTCGRPPFRAETTVAVLKRVVDEAPRPIRDVLPSAPEWLCTIIAKLHAKRPADRFQSARELADLFARCQSDLEHRGRVDLPGLPAPESVLAPPPPPRRSPRGVLAAGAVIALVAGLGLTEATGLTDLTGAVRGRRAPTGEPTTRDEPQVVPAADRPEPGRAVPADALRREDIPRAVLASMGGGDPARAPADLVAVFGEGRFRTCGYGARAPSFSPDDSVLVVSSEHEVYLFDPGTGERRAVFGPFGTVMATCFAPDGGTLAVGDQAVHLVDARTGLVLRTLEQPVPSEITRLYFTPGGKHVVGGSQNGSGATVWDAATGALVRELPACFYGGGRDRDGQSLVLARAADDARINFFAPESGELVFRGPKWPKLRWPEEVVGAALSADGRHVALGAPDRVAVWDLDGLRADPDARPVFDKKTPGGWVCFEQATGRLWTGDFSVRPSLDDRARCWDLATGRDVGSVPLRRGTPEVWHALSHDARTLYASAGVQTSHQVYDTRTGAPRVARRGHSHTVSSLAWSPDGLWLASASHDATLRIWDAATGAEKHVLPWDAGQIRQVAFHPDGSRLAARDDNGNVALWRTADGTRVWSVRPGAGAWQSVRFSPDGRILAVPTRTGGVKFLRASTGEELRSWEAVHRGEALRVAFSPDGRLVATGGTDGVVAVTDVETGRAVHKFTGGTSTVDAVEFTPDGRAVASGSHEPEPAVRLWDLKTGEPTVLPTLRSVYGLAVSDRFIVSCDGSHTVRLWDLADPARGSVALTSLGDEKPHRVALSPDGGYAATPNLDGTVHVYRLNRPGETVSDWMTARRGPPRGLSNNEWLRRVAALSPGNLFDAVGDRFRELNPTPDQRFGGGEVRGGQVRTFWVSGRKVTDFSALAALPGLRSANLFYTLAADADLDHLKGATGLRTFDAGEFYGTTRLTGGAAERLREWTDLEGLGLWGTQFSDAGLERITTLRYLKRLDVGRTKVTDAGLPFVARFPELGELKLNFTPVTDAGLASVRSLPRLHALFLEGTRVTDAGLEHLSGLKHLWRLDLNGTKVRGPGLDHLRNLPRLRELSLSGAPVTDEALTHLTALPALTHLTLGGCPITDDGLDRLGTFTRLRRVYLKGTKVTAAGVAKLAKALPHCHIEWDPPGK